MRTCLYLASSDKRAEDLRQEVATLLRQHDIRVTDAYDIAPSTPLTAGILQLLEEAEIVVVDLVDASPAVYFEAGLAAARGKRVIFLDHKDSQTGHPGVADRLWIDDASPGQADHVVKRVVELMQKLPRRGESIMDTEAPPGGIALSRAQQQVHEEVATALAKGASATIWVQGPRGAGKTKLLDHLRNSEDPRICRKATAVMINAGVIRPEAALHAIASDILQRPRIAASSSVDWTEAAVALAKSTKTLLLLVDDSDSWQVAELVGLQENIVADVGPRVVFVIAGGGPWKHLSLADTKIELTWDPREVAEVVARALRARHVPRERIESVVSSITKQGITNPRAALHLVTRDMSRA